MFHTLGNTDLVQFSCFADWNLKPRRGEMTYPASYRSDIKSFHVLMGRGSSNSTRLLAFTPPVSLLLESLASHICQQNQVWLQHHHKKKEEDVKLYNQYDPHYETLCAWMINAYLAHIRVVKKKKILKRNTQIANWDCWRNANDFGFHLFKCSAFSSSLPWACPIHSTFIEHLPGTAQGLKMRGG